MSVPYTQGIWQEKPGQADEFVAAWTGDASDPNRFVPFGPWQSLEAIESRRAPAGSQAGTARSRESLERFEPARLARVVEVGCTTRG